MAKLYMTKGLPASGKTTWAKNMQKKNGNIVRVNKDDLRSMLHDSKHSSGREKRVLQTRDFIVNQNLSEGRDVIVDDTNFNPIHEEKLQAIAKENNAEFVIKEFNVDLKECIKRDLKRENSVGEKVIKQMYRRYLSDYNDRRPLNPLVFDEDLPDCVIFDLDGTIAHINGRSPYDGKSCESDLVNESIKSLLDIIKFDSDYSNNKIIIMSGRSGESQPETEKWLLDNKIHYDELHMRKPGDNRKDSVIKRDLFDENIRDKYNVLFVVDDRNQVVDLWRSMGITCLQCNYGDF